MPQTNTSTATRRAPLPIAGRAMELRGFARAAASSADGAEAAPLATAEIVFSSGAGVQRYDWFRERNYIEELVVQDGAIRMGRLQRGAPLLNSHSSWDLEDQLGVVEKVISAREKLAFSDDEVRDSLGALTNATGSGEEALRRHKIAMDLARGANIPGDGL